MGDMFKSKGGKGFYHIVDVIISSPTVVVSLCERVTLPRAKATIKSSPYLPYHLCQSCARIQQENGE